MNQIAILSPQHSDTTLLATSTTIIATASTTDNSYGEVEIDITSQYIEPETVEEAREATRQLNARKRMLGDIKAFNDRKNELAAEMIDLLTKLIATPASDPARLHVKSAYLESKDRYYAHKRREL